MTRSDPQAIEQALRQANLDKTGAEEWAWMRERWPEVSEDALDDLRRDRQRHRARLRKRAAAHQRYLSRLAQMRHDPVELENFRQAHREAQSRYHDRHKDTINAKARARRSARNKVNIDTPSNTAPTNPPPVVANTQLTAPNASQANTTSHASLSATLTVSTASPLVQANADKPLNILTTSEVVAATASSSSDGQSITTGSAPISSSNGQSSTDSATIPLQQHSSASGSSNSSTTNPSSTPAANDDDDDEEIDGETHQGVGHPSSFSEEQLKYMEDHLVQFMSYPSRSNERSEFWPAFFPPFLEFFPLADFNLPPSNTAPLRPLTPQALAALTVDDRRKYKRKLKYRERTPEERYKDMVKSHFRWRAGRYTRKGSSKGINQVLESFNKADGPPRKRQLSQFVMTHPKYRERVREESVESGRDDVLACRRTAAETIIAKMSEEERQEMEDAVNEEHARALAEWSESTGKPAGKGAKKGAAKGAAVSADSSSESANKNTEPTQDSLADQLKAQEGFGATMKDLLNHLREKTGLSFVLMAGQSLDGKDQFRSVIIESCPEGNRSLEHFDFNSFRDFGKTFHKWLREIYFQNNGGLSSDVRDLIGRDVDDSTLTVQQIEQPQQSSEATSQSTTNSRAKSKPKARSKSKGKTQKGRKSDLGDISDSSEDGGKDQHTGADGEEYVPGSGERLRESDDVEMERPSPSTPVNPGAEDLPDVEIGSAEFEALPYEVKRALNMRRNKDFLANLTKELDLPEFITKSAKAKGQPPRPRAKRTKSTTHEPLRKSSRIKPNVDYQEPTLEDPVEEEAENVRGISSSAGPTMDWRSQLLEARELFIADKMEVKEMTDLVEKLTPQGSKARTDWVAHVSALSEASLDMDPLNTTWPEPPTTDLPVSVSSKPLTEDVSVTSPTPATTPTPASTPNTRALLLRARQLYIDSDEGVTELKKEVERLTAAGSASREMWVQHISALIDARRSRDGLHPQDEWPKPPEDDGDVDAGSGDHPVNSPATSVIPLHVEDVEMVGILSKASSEESGASAEQVLPSLTSAESPPSDRDASVVPSEALQLASREICALDGEVEVPVAKSTYAIEGISNEALRRMAQIFLASKHTREWKSVVYLWLEVQNAWEKKGWTDGNASTRDRPDGFITFGKAGRNRPGGLVTPGDASLANLREVWPTWWRNAQPEWRIQPDGTLQGREGDWSGLRLASSRGFMMFLLGLRWWYDLEVSQAEDMQADLELNLQQEGWNGAVKSTYNVLLALLEDAGGKDALGVLQEIMGDASTASSPEDALSQSLKRQIIDDVASGGRKRARKE
ncbi:hypothetical protein VNI00_018622 [Paramarasmius palmivorus]|uniref:Uncharacterized protein n=1 Tax=Paramarasmius palmivorus TaxID=297713 RepID=A0AAW0AVF5_9AGAR